MTVTKGPSALKEQIYSLEQDITDSLSAELTRIARPVNRSEFLSDPLVLRDISYLKVSLNEESEVVSREIYQEVPDTLSELLQGNRVSHWDLIYLLEALRDL